MLKVTDQLRIIAFLKNFGCNNREAGVYIEALKAGITSIQELSRKLKRNRITVHYTVQQLIKKGFLFETRKGTKRLIAAEKPEVLSRMIEHRYNELKSMENQLGYVTKLLNSLEANKNEVTMVKVYDDIEGFKKMLEQSLEAKTEILVFTNMIFSRILGEDYVINYYERRAAHNIHTRVIYPPGPFATRINAKKNEYKIEVRTLPQDERSESGFYLWDNTLALQSLHEGKRCCTLIENRYITHFFRSNIFNHFWEEATPL